MSSEEISSCEFSPKNNCILRCDGLARNNPFPGLFHIGADTGNNFLSYQGKANELRNKCVKKCSML